MPDTRPELIFVTGPQKGQRAVLMDNEVIVGRSVQAGVKIIEETVSRQHLRFTLTVEGWMVENLSANRVEISGESYKRGRQVLLETGDTILIGAETTLLFVGPNDDPMAAMAKFHSDNPAQPKPLEIPTPATPQPTPAPKPAAPPVQKKVAPLSASEQLAADKKRKTKFYISAVAVYLVAMAGLFVFLAIVKKTSAPSTSSDKPSILSRSDIEAALTCELNHAPNAEASAKHLRLAREYYRTRNAADKNLYLCVKNYRLYLSFRRPDQKTFQIEDERQFNDAKKELVDKIMSIYDNAWALENGRHWSQAMGEFELLIQRYIPPAELPQLQTTQDKLNDSTVMENIQDHISYISKFLRKRK